jgi:acyl dehydratase
MQVGDVYTWDRTFTEEDVRLFGQLSGDHGIQHIAPDELGRIMVHGLLTATLPTKIGEFMNYIAHDMSFEFLRPVFVGDSIHCEVVVTHLTQQENRIVMRASWVCTNQRDHKVLTGHTSGIIRIPDYDLVGRH